MRIAIPDRLQFLPNMLAAQKATDASLEGKTCVITGATSGVGLAATRRIAQGGADILVIARNPQKAEDLRSLIRSESGASLDVVIADLASLHDVRNAASAIAERCPKVHLLINSAGVFSTKRVVAHGGIELTFCVNHLAAFLLTRLLLDRMIASAPARIIQVNSQGHRFGGLRINDLNWQRRLYNGYLSYGASKTAQLLTVWKLADMLRGTRVTINAMHPGGVRTNIGNNNGPLYRWFSRNVIWHFLKDPKVSGEAIYFLAAAPEMSNISGRYFNRTAEEKPAPHALDGKLGQAVWAVSEELVGLVPCR